MDLNPVLLCVTDRDSSAFVGASFSLASAVVTALLAPSRGRSAFWWFFIGGFLPWLSILVLYLLRDLSLPPEPAATAPAVGGPPEWPSTSEPGLALPQDGWYYADRRKALGPVSLPFLRGAIQAGSLPKNVHVWCSAFRNWIPPHRVPGFFG